MPIIADFARLLRKNNLRVSVAELIDAEKAVEHVGFESQIKLRSALASTLVKHSREISIFNLCFDTYFSSLSGLNGLAAPKEAQFSPSNATELQSKSLEDHHDFEDLFQDLTNEERTSVLLQLSAGSRGLGRSFLGGNRQSTIRFFMQTILNRANSLQAMDPTIRDIRADFIGALKALDQNHPLRSPQSRLYLDEIIQTARERIVDNPLEYEFVPKIIDVLELPFSEPSGRWSELEKEIRRLGQKLATRERLRRKRARHGKIDFRRTLRANLQHGGWCFQLQWKHRRINRPDFIFLNDVSTSVAAPVAEWFFILAYYAHRVFPRLRVFEFDNITVEITAALRRETLKEALYLRQKLWNPHRDRKKHDNHSDYWTSLLEFAKYTEGKLRKSKVLFILGDCRDWLGRYRSNGEPESKLVLKELTQQIKRTIILNPELPAAWNRGDSIVGHFEQVGAEVYPASNLKELVQVIDRFF
ncbi:MAG: VWA domain-containing protein [Candidatus Heimdallarchaeota archaeon]